MKKQWMVRALPEALTRASISTFFARSLCSSASTAAAPTSTSTSSPSFAIKNVTKSNFDSVLSDLRRLVKEADFVAVDLEMTGVTSAPWRDSFEFDSFDVRYLKVKDSAEKFAVLQFGACPFRWDSAKKSLIAHPHNFYIFPQQEIAGDGPSYEFLCQTTSIDFLARYQFDFNLCIQEGISYLSRRQENEALRRLRTVYEDEPSGNLRNARDELLVRMADVLFTERIKNRISEWRDRLLLNRTSESTSHQSSNDSSSQFETIFFKMRPAILLHGFTSHQLRLIQLVIQKYFTNLVFVRANNGTPSVQHVVVYVDSDNDRGLLMKDVKDELRQEAERKIDAAVGFRSIIDLLSSEKKLIVGHNCFLDMAHIYSKFFGPLPSTVEEYISSIHKYFPYIVDTKLLLNSTDALRSMMRKRGTSLSKAFAHLCPELASGTQSLGLGLKHHVQVEVQVDDLRSSNWNSGAKHEAGYDAFMTGCVFSQACYRLGIDLQLDSPFANLVHNEKLQKQINLLYLSWINGVVVDLTTGKVNADSSYSTSTRIQSSQTVFSNIALIWGFPSTLKSRTIKERIVKAFGPSSVSSVYHLDESAVFVQFTKEKFVGEFLQLKATLETHNDPISVIHPLAELLEGGNTHASTYEFYREICRSPASEVLFADQVRAVGITWKTEPVTPKAKIEKPVTESSSEENGTDSSSNAVHDRESGNLNRLISELSRGRLEGYETGESSYPVEAQVTK